MPLEFEPITLDLQKAYLIRLSQCSQIASDYSFINLWGWAEAHGLSWAWEDDVVWIRQTRPDTRYWAPVGPWQHIDWDDRLRGRFPEPARFVRIPDRLLDIWQPALGKRLLVEAARGDWDYLYAADDLIHLRGNRFHKKKNLVNQFRKKVDFTFQEMDGQMIDQALGMQEDWCTWRDCEAHDTLAAENLSIERILKSWPDLVGILGGALSTDQRMVAYTVAEKLTDRTLLIHFEKADPSYKGAYQAINQLFLQQAATEARWINREQDLDDAGLRKAKLSYHPVDFLRKHTVRLS